MTKRSFISIVILLIASTMLLAQNDSTFHGWKQAETEHFRFIFEDASREATEAYAQYADEAWNKIAKIYAIPQDKTDIFVTARTNTVNAFTFFIPPEIMMFNTYPTLAEFGFRDNWQKLFFTHELVHIANLQFEDKSYVTTKLFGQGMRALGMLDVPSWALEGLTTVMETELTDGGRGRSPYFELMYKAPTLDNAFISYANIGVESEPPHGQSYVMGYLIMRSIADRWGMEALADIERNRSMSVSWEASVKLVTGESAEDIYKDVRIALAKKYATERSIPEGITISPRTVNTYYYKPAIVNDDGTIITLRSASGTDAAVVRLDPSAKDGRAYLEDTHPEKGLNTLMSETVLFAGDFSDSTAVTADADGTIYASLAKQRGDRMPGVEVEYALFKWTKESGLKQLTKNGSFFEPSVSRDGTMLIAVEQRGLQMMLVHVDTATGEVTPLLQNDKMSFIQPAVNADGSKVAFLVADGHRAAVAFSAIGGNGAANDGGIVANESLRYVVVANGSGPIVDPAYPSWNGNGNLLYACNTRGRLEEFEVEEMSEMADALNDSFASKPMVTDPIGVLWAYKTERGVYYESYASTGTVIKMKPAEEWGAVSEKEGPSPAGEKICFGALESDYPFFTPYEKPSEKEEPSDGKKKSFAEQLEGKNQKDDVPVAIRGKTVAHRTEENKKRAEECVSLQKTLQNEKLYFPTPVPVCYLPLVDETTSGKDNSDIHWGIGYGAILITPKLQMQYGFIEAAAVYYPDISNLEGNLLFSVPVGSSTLDFMAARTLMNHAVSENAYQYIETNFLITGYTIPLVHRIQHHNELDVSVLTFANIDMDRQSDDSISLDSTIPYTVSMNALAGLDFAYAKQCAREKLFNITATTIGVGSLYPADAKTYAGIEYETEVKYGNDGFKTEIGFRGRYTDFPSVAISPMSRAHLSGESLGCEYPGRVVVRAGSILSNFLQTGFDMEVFAEKLFSYGKNTVDYKTPDSGLPGNITFDSTVVAGVEAGMAQGRQKIAVGYTLKYDFDSMKLSKGKFYGSVKFNWFRY